MCKKECEYCHKEFDYDEDMEEFETECSTSREGLRKTLCASCAIEAFENGEDGVYFETCEICGKTFDYALADSEFNENMSPENGTCLRDYWSDHIRCAECALDAVQDEYNRLEDESE